MTVQPRQRRRAKDRPDAFENYCQNSDPPLLDLRLNFKQSRAFPIQIQLCKMPIRCRKQKCLNLITGQLFKNLPWLFYYLNRLYDCTSFKPVNN